MAGPDPRRSSRARPLQSQSQQSSTTSSNSGRLERSTRSLNRNTSPQKSTPTASLSSEPPEESIATTDDILSRPRRTRAKDEDIHPSPIISEIEMAHHEEDDIQEDDEAVRCVCGEDEYPGPPSPEDLRPYSKDGLELDSAYPSETTDDLAGFFIQCDTCKVWQHGACVGLTNDHTLPEEYACEECRKDLHRIFTRPNGPQFSIYLPLARGSRATSVIKEGTRSPKEKENTGRATSASHSGKRRSTMNSRHVYDEEEALRRAIEESKVAVGSEGAEETSTRRPKRGRDEDSEEKQENKRTRTTSRSPSPDADKQEAGDDSDDALATRNGNLKKSRSQANMRSQQLKSDKDREEKERIRAEAAGRRKGRAERRRADDSDPSEELPLAARAKPDRQAPTTTESVPAIEPAPSSQPSPDTPSASLATDSKSKSKNARASHKKKGRNQYTRDITHPEGGDSPARSQSRDVHENTASAARSAPAETSKSHKGSKANVPKEPTWADMKRRVQFMLDFITKTQLELVHETNPARFGILPTPPDQANGNSLDSNPVLKATMTGIAEMVNGLVTPAGTALSGSAPEKGKEDKQPEPAPELEKPWEQLTIVEMMDFLTKRLIHWQNEFGP